MKNYKVYKTQGAMKNALIKLLETKPENPIKGRGYSRENIDSDLWHGLRKIQVRDSALFAHTAIIYARRGKGKYVDYSRNDLHVVSDELGAFLDANYVGVSCLVLGEN